MHFTPDTEDALGFTVDLLNTVAGATRSGLDELSTTEQLGVMLASWQYSGRIDHDGAELAEVRLTRERLRRIWLLDRDDAVPEVNAMLSDAGALPHLVRHDNLDWHLHATDPEAPLAERIRVEVALAIVDVIRSDENSRLRACDAFDCDGLLLDLSRNGSKRFCSVRCGNRMNMVAFRERAARA
ncbi:CGNR zinc finger domain-containing protein [Subtercola boreus]|uniref:RNA-binding protein n=1 Tax=Subtercola boreus TaxID=120213 RepID=A0A3E0W7U9_9MICO|nr:CGNR zinc finger domain-containing protein [Subtercola boreus]RFA19097.1 RNA-binding protein [Subtercola boreus]RFA19235.1 RNA-binding protein [Subtercola boreus]RFA25697.1 RNA-binding protein [Subtercola boreus]